MTLSFHRLLVLMAACLAVAACYGGEGALSLATGSGLTDADTAGGDARPYKAGCDRTRRAAPSAEAPRATAPPAPAPTAAGSTRDLDDVLLFPVVFGGPGLSSYDINCDPDAGPYGTCQ